MFGLTPAASIDEVAPVTSMPAAAAAVPAAMAAVFSTIIFKALEESKDFVKAASKTPRIDS